MALRKAFLFAVGLGLSSTGLAQVDFRIGRIIGSNGLEPIENGTGTTYYDMARSVARVEMGGGFCTGFRVGESLMMTNHHCLATCTSMVFRFGYERAVARDQQVTFRCSKIEAKNSTLDYSLIRVVHESGPNPDAIPIVTLDRSDLAVDQQLFIAGHPSARMKEMDRSDDCKVAALPTATNSNLSHTCDTESGNSGSSVFDRATGHVVGLHWGYSELNQANWMDRIVANIEAQVPDVATELSVVGGD